MILTVALLAQYAGTLDVFDTTSVDVRATQPAPVISARTVPVESDLVTTPTAQVRLTTRSTEATATYAPTVTVADIQLGGKPLFIQSGAVYGAWHDRRLRLSLSEYGTYGQLNSGLFYQPVTLPGQPVRVQAAPAAETLDYGSSTTEATVGYNLDRRANVYLSGGYTVDGGLTTAAQGLLPLQTIERGGASATYLWTRQDLLTTQATLQEIDTTGECPPAIGAAAPPPGTTAFCREKARIAQLEEMLAHRLSATTLLTLGAGMALTAVEAPSLNITEYAPVATASLMRQLGRTSTFFLSAYLAPLPDVRTGLVTERVESTVDWTEAVTARLTLTFTAGALRSIPFPSSDPFPLTVLRGGAIARMRIDRNFEVGLGLQAFWQDQAVYGTLESEIGYVSVIARLPTVRF